VFQASESGAVQPMWQPLQRQKRRPRHSITRNRRYGIWGAFLTTIILIILTHRAWVLTQVCVQAPSPCCQQGTHNLPNVLACGCRCEDITSRPKHGFSHGPLFLFAELERAG
jgi:hypothetical protein